MPPLPAIIEPIQLSGLTNFLLFDAGGSPESRQRYSEIHLKDAVYVDLDTQLSAIPADAANGGRHPLPHIHTFAQTITNLGIQPDSHVIIYDDKNGSNAAARFWWMLRAFGHQNVQVLNGGLQHARHQNYPTETGWQLPQSAPTLYPVSTWQLPIMHLDEVALAAQNPEFRVVDVRSEERYNGITEPIDLIAGHIPGAINIPFTDNLDKDGCFLPGETLREKLNRQLDHVPMENVAVHCGSGVTACHTLLAAAHAGLPIPALYVGSWSEWSRNDKPIAP
ncbi:MAG: thiosulfate/3-mercaptopyruvate sulfurtransferase [Bacteroidetes bacterium HLUCCA01]|nr:MAG: thiosulfate/3-mercaptopyruvate sulfurtransferase [Bacteroidetes bacterium HLUCCA01]